MKKLNKGGLIKMSTKAKKLGMAVNNFLSKHGTTILTTVGVASCGMAVYEAFKSAEDIKATIAEVDETVDPELPKAQIIFEKAKAVAPVAAPTVVWFTFGAGCVIAAHRADSKKVAALTTAYELSETYRREYVNKVREKLGDKKAKEIEDDFHQEQAQKNMPTGPNDPNICLTGHGNQLYFDEASGRFLRACPQWLEKCKVDISHQIFMDDYASVNDFYDILGIPTCGLGELAGWESSHDLDGDGLIDMRWDSRASTSEWGETFGFITYYPKTRFKI